MKIKQEKELCRNCSTTLGNPKDLYELDKLEEYISKLIYAVQFYAGDLLKDNHQEKDHIDRIQQDNYGFLARSVLFELDN